MKTLNPEDVTLLAKTRRRDPAVDRAMRRCRRRSNRPCAPIITALMKDRRIPGGGAFERDRRGPSRRVVRRPAGKLSQHRRLRERASRHQARFRIALQRPRDFLPRPQGLRPRDRRALGRHPAHGAQRPGVQRRDVHARYRIGLHATWCSSPPPTGLARPWCRARSIPTSSTSTSRCSRRASFPSSAARWDPRR